MNFVAVLFLACIAIHSGFSSDPALNTSSLSESIPPSEELETCPTNSSITVKVLRSLQGNWVTTFVATDKDADNSSEVFVGEHRNISGGEDAGKGMQEIASRLESIENTLQSFNETMHQMKNMLKNVPNYSYFMHFDSLIKGKNINLHDNRRTAIRIRPSEEYGLYGGVLSNNPLRDDVAFEVRIDETIDQWRNHGIALGVIVEKDEAVKEEGYICHHVPGTYCIRSWDYAVKGKSHILKDGNRISENAYNMDTRDLPVGTTLGVVRRSNNALHFLLNGFDKGVAFSNVQEGVYAFLDVSDYVSKITIIS